MTTYPAPTDPVNALTRADATTEAHSTDHGRVIGIWENVKHYGAKGDGVTDDTAAVAATITAAGSGVVYFPAGDYLVSSTLTPLANSVWRGSGARSWDYDSGGTVIRSTVTGTPAINLDTISHVRLEDFQLRCTSDTSGVVGVKFNDPSNNCSVRNVVFRGPGTSNATAIQFEGQASCNCHNVFDSMLIRNWNEGIRLSGYANANVFTNISTATLSKAIRFAKLGTDTLGGNDNLFQRIEMDGGTPTGITLADSASRNVFMKCVEDGVDTTGVDITSGQDNIFIGCTISPTLSDAGVANLFIQCVGSGTGTPDNPIKWYDLNWYRSGTAEWGTDGKLRVLGTALTIDGQLNHDGTTVGFYGVTPTARSSARTITNLTPDRALDCDSTSTPELADVLGTLIEDLKLTGIIA